MRPARLVLALPGLAWAVADLARMAGAAGHRLPAGAAPAPDSIAVVVPARDEEVLLPGCLDLLGRQPAVRELVVVDDGSSDATVAVARACGARVVAAGPRPEGWAGKAWALHQGTQETTAPWLVFVDADVRVAGPWVAALVAAAEADGVPAACLLGRQEGWLEFEAGLLVARRACRFRKVNAGQATYLIGQCVAVRRDALSKAGGWEAVKGSAVEDIELGERLGAHRVYAAFAQMKVASRGAVRASWVKNMWRTHGGPRGLVGEAAHLATVGLLPWLAGPGGGAAVYAVVAFGRLGARVAAGEGARPALLPAAVWPLADAILLAIFGQSVLSREARHVRP